MMNIISPSQLQQVFMQQPEAMLIDVRSPAEYRALHVTQAINLPLDQIDEGKVQEFMAEHDELFFICQSGGRSKKACELFEKFGFEKVHSIEGGTSAWDQQGLPVDKGKTVMSIERQVRILAGVLVTLGITLGWFVHPGFLGLSLFIGLGLVFAGVTDTCGMGIILGKMPWNQ